MEKKLIQNLTKKANLLRCHVVKMVYEAQSGHPGGALSAADIIAALYFHEMRVDPENPEWQDRDRFILSKGHACAVWYAALAERGFFPLKELSTFRKFGTILQGHPDMKKTPGVDMTSGSLGNGLSVGVGMALGAKIDRKNYRVFVMLGDGEVQEGAVWEAAMAASHYKLDNLIAIVDYNGLQVDGWVKEVLSVEPLVEKWKSCGWYTIEIDGHDMGAILEAFYRIKKIDRPSVIIAHTIKGKGVPFMENQVKWHAKAPTKEQLEQALQALEARCKDE